MFLCDVHLVLILFSFHLPSSKAVHGANNPALTAKFSLCSDGERCLGVVEIVLFQSPKQH